MNKMAQNPINPNPYQANITNTSNPQMYNYHSNNQANYNANTNKYPINQNPQYMTQYNQTNNMNNQPTFTSYSTVNQVYKKGDETNN